MKSVELFRAGVWVWISQLKTGFTPKDPANLRELSRRSLIVCKSCLARPNSDSSLRSHSREPCSDTAWTFCHVVCCYVMWRDVMWCDVMLRAVILCYVIVWDTTCSYVQLCGIMWCAVPCFAVPCFAVLWSYVLWCYVIWCEVRWSDVVWCGALWCGVGWCGVTWCKYVSTHPSMYLCEGGHLQVHAYARARARGCVGVRARTRACPPFARPRNILWYNIL